jgi:hypothetical protein
MSVATGLVAARAAVDALRASIEELPASSRRGGCAVRILHIVGDCFDLVEDDLCLGDRAERCDVCGDVLDAEDIDDHRQQAHADDV